MLGVYVRIRAKLASFGMLMDDANARVNLYIMFLRTLHVYEKVQLSARKIHICTTRNVKICIHCACCVRSQACHDVAPM